MRDVSYTINYTSPTLPLTDFTGVTITEEGGRHWLHARYKDSQQVEDQLADIDVVRLRQGEVTADDLVRKYFAYLL